MNIHHLLQKYCGFHSYKVLLITCISLSLSNALYAQSCICNPGGSNWITLESKVSSIGQNVTIAAGEQVFVDGDQSIPAMNRLIIQKGGILAFKNDTASITLNRMMVMGVLQIGCPACPISKENTITLNFQPPNKKPISADDLELMVHAGGEVYMYAEKGLEGSNTKSWTYLSKPAGPTDKYGLGNGVAKHVESRNDKTILFLEDNVAGNWSAGDWIMVATTDFTSHHSEFVKIQSIKSLSKGCRIRLSTPLKYYHFGSAPPSDDSFWDGADNNYGIDERAEVALISKSIRLVAQPSNDASSTSASKQYGGDIHIMKDFGAFHMQGVEIERFGKDTISNYPLHFHRCGEVDPTKVTINSNSIHHTFNKCITVHETSNLNVSFNVCARTIGHGVYLEDARETDNTFNGNLMAGMSLASFDPTSSFDPYWDGDNIARQPNYSYDYKLANATTVADSKAPTGFWITHPHNRFTNNSVAGVQGRGRGYWYIVTQGIRQLDEQPKLPYVNVLEFSNNRAHGCYTGLDNTSEETIGAPEARFIPQNMTPQHTTGTVGDSLGKGLVSTFSKLTITRCRNRGLWLRPWWLHVDSARIATCRSGAALVSSGGVEGSPPGIWMLMSNTIFAGITTNNVERFGPCKEVDCLGDSKEGKGFVVPPWNLTGYMFYDGPARLETCRFVGFRVNPTSLLTKDDANWLRAKAPDYEGDAALGWFQSNAQDYPPIQYTKELFWENTNFRHQIYTEDVNLGVFNDGDKNTVILDLDGTLSGYMITNEQGSRIKHRYPLSLNNLPFHASPWSVDECLSIGHKDSLETGRETSLISPHDFATMEVAIWHSSDNDTCAAGDSCLIIRRDQPIYGANPSLGLNGRNNSGMFEPKVIDKMGYTIYSTKEGMPRYISLGVVDVTKPKITSDPFMVRVGVCYNAAGGQKPKGAGSFVVKRGVKSFGGPVGIQQDQLTRNNLWYFNPDCRGLPQNFHDKNSVNCPGNSVVLNAVSSIDKLDEHTFFYDSIAGMVFLYVMQDEFNTEHFSPLGVDDANKKNLPFTFYSCPPSGCPIVTIEVTDPNYKVGTTPECNCYGASANFDYTQDYFNYKHYLGRVPEDHIKNPIKDNVLARSNGSLKVPVLWPYGKYTPSGKNAGITPVLTTSQGLFSFNMIDKTQLSVPFCPETVDKP